MSRERRKREGEFCVYVGEKGILGREIVFMWYVGNSVIFEEIKVK